ncbi:hypothetical protein E2C01_068068 [Portunus trituberculatus]|uniref:Uncharacterized protein n=1 Tax=Portunus trituberculatus TaxID=210409 RepID=A0A5B7HLH1_PORTR|nr:hypothetical protein [Portunus trituberculatus]
MGTPEHLSDSLTMCYPLAVLLYLWGAKHGMNPDHHLYAATSTPHHHRFSLAPAQRIKPCY